jgi:hypothetical protein
MQKTKRKRVLRFIRKAAESLPEKTYKAYHKYASPLYTYNEDGSKSVSLGYLQDHPINHARRMKRLYDRHGLIAVDAYLRFYGHMIAVPEA